PVVLDDTPPGYPAQLWTRSGYDSKETTDLMTDGTDNDSDGIVDDRSNLPVGNVQLFWSRVPDFDAAEYRIYRSGQPKMAGCTCNPTADPLGDCDKDGIINSLDTECPCTPVAPNFSQFGDYELIATKTATQACPPSVNSGYPAGTITQNVCTTIDNGTQPEDALLCSGSRFWYSVVAVDSKGNSLPLDQSHSMSASLKKQADTIKPSVPAKPDVASAIGSNGIVVKFTENAAADPNLDLMGYNIYRDEKPSGDYKLKVAILSDKTQLSYCTVAGKAPCYCDVEAPTKACYFDISVLLNKRYYYKISAFDVNGNESDKSTANFGTAATNPPDAATAFCARSDTSNKNSLFLTWNGSNLLNNPDISGFMIYRSADENNWSVIDPVPETPNNIEMLRATAYTDTSLVGGQKYCYLLITKAKDGGESSNVITCGVSGEDLSVPQRPTGLTTVPSSQSVLLSWGRSGDLDIAGYNVYRSDSKEGKLTKVNNSTLTESSFTDSGLANDRVYWYCVTAIDKNVRSGLNTCYKVCSQLSDLTCNTNPACEYNGTACVNINGIDASNESPCSTRVSAAPYAGGGSGSRLNFSLSKGWNLISLPVSAGAQASLTVPGANPVGRAASMYALISKDYLEVPVGAIAGNISARGLWYYSEEEGSANLEGVLNPLPIQDIQLGAGWNLVGNPFDADIFWTKGSVKVSIDGATFIDLDAAEAQKYISAFKYSSGDNNGSGSYTRIALQETIPKGMGFWVKTDRAMTLRISK
ncbi:MAG: fibronectin type III domain-containing protein, partial [bacterium]